MSDESQSAPPVPTPPAATPHRRRRWPVLLALPVASTIGVWTADRVLVAGPVAGAIARDSRNTGYSLSAHYRHFVLPGTLVLDLRAVDAAAPVDLLRGLFLAADTLSQLGRRFDRVILARSGEPVFVMKGEDFQELGREYGAGQNPVYLIRTLPEKLYRYADGRQAYGTWEGGWLGVVARQMQDVSDAATAWARGPETGR